MYWVIVGVGVFERFGVPLEGLFVIFCIEGELALVAIGLEDIWRVNGFE